jgi:hypothetical protein
MASSLIRKAGFALSGLVGVAIVVSLMTLALPKTEHIERSALVAATPSAVFTALSSPVRLE